MRNPWLAFDEYSKQVEALFELYGYSLDGLLEENLRERPSTHGLYFFMGKGADLQLKTVRGVESIMRSALSDLRLFPDGSAESTLGLFLRAANNQLGNLLLSYGKRFRDVLAARAWEHYAHSADPRVTTRAGRSMLAKDWGYLSSRKTLIDAYNETQLAEILNQGASKFYVFHSDPSDSRDQEIFEIQDYPEIKDVIFHPRSNLIIGGAYVHSEQQGES